MQSFADGAEWQLVFSDEFNTDNRTFWPGDDPYWEAANLHYWQVRFALSHLSSVILTSIYQTNDLEWYWPDQAVTKDGALELTLAQRTMNNLDYVSGMVSTWNKFCFTGGMVLTSVTLPGANDVSGAQIAAHILSLTQPYPSRTMACRFAHSSLLRRRTDVPL